MGNLTTAAALTAGPFGVLAYVAGGKGGVQLVARAGDPGAAVAPLGTRPGGHGLTTGLNVAGMAAVASAVNTYLGGLTAAQIAGLPSAFNGCPYVLISPGEVNVPCAAADVATFAATVAAILDTAANYGPVGT